MTSDLLLLTRLLADCHAHGVRLLLTGDGGLAIDAPQDAVTLALIGRLKAHKCELLAMLRHRTVNMANDMAHPAGIPQDVVDRAEGDLLLAADGMEALPLAGVSVPGGLSEVGEPRDLLAPDELEPCPMCGTLELWQTIAGSWRCQRCDPPTSARRLRELAARLRRRTDRGSTTEHNG